MKTIENFSNTSDVTRTVKMALVPVGNTRRLIDEMGILDEDRLKATAYQEAKPLLDDFYKHMIEESLSIAALAADEKLVFNEYETIFRAWRTDKKSNSRKIVQIQNECRKIIALKLMNGMAEKAFDEAYLSIKVLQKVRERLEPGKAVSLDVFKGFAGYFDSYFETRKNIFSSKDIPTGVAYRVVNDNYPKFFGNCEKWRRITNSYPDLAEQITEQLRCGINEDAENIFDIDRFILFSAQSRIDEYNNIIGGYSIDELHKVQGINELVNLYCQQHPEVKRRDLQMATLFKQILSDRVSLSYSIEKFTNDTDLRSAAKEVLDDAKNIIADARRFLCSIADYDQSCIYISEKRQTYISQILFSDWSFIRNALYENYLKSIQGKQTKSVLEYAGKWSQGTHSVYELQLAIDESEKRVSDLLSKAVSEILSAYDDKIIAFESLITSDSRIKNNQDNVALFKSVMDSMNDFARLLRNLLVTNDELSCDEEFYSQLRRYTDALTPVVTLYNKARNYISTKVIPEKHFKLNFKCSTLGNGWDQNKENDNLCVIMRKDGFYYLGIIQKGQKIDFASLAGESDSCYEKLVFKTLSDVRKMTPKCLFAAKTRSNPAYASYSVLYDAYLRKKEGKNSYWLPDYSSETDYNRAVLEYYIKEVPEYSDWTQYGFLFRSAAEYGYDLNVFFDDFQKQASIMRFEQIPAQTVDELVASGRLYLFHIYTKDFAPGATGRKNLHTIYFEQLFSDENIKNGRIQLNGNAELFYRPAIKGEKIVHPAGSKLVSRNLKDGTRLSDDVFSEIYKYHNERLSFDELCDESRRLLPLVTVKEARTDIVKDRRFHVERFEFHVPMTFKTAVKDSRRFNDRVLDVIRNDESVNIIGIDRGERNLIYVSIINQKGEILLQKSFNAVDSGRENQLKVDYLSKLEVLENSRDAARKGWSSISRIADLKKGYLSYVIHEICCLMLKYNAIVVLENLNVGFKRGRMKVERQVYQNFEAMLIRKLNYLAVKDIDLYAPGGIMNGLQLTEKFESFAKLKNQTGWVFYVPAGFTSKIDPVTGFSNLFSLKGLTNVEKKASFFSRFDSIRFDPAEGDFKFSFDYGNFSDCAVKQEKGSCWTVSSRNERLVYFPTERKTERIFPTDELRKLLSSNGISYEHGENLLSALAALGTDKSQAAFYDRFYQLFKIILQMRNSSAAEKEDYILSPVPDSNGVYFDSRNFTPSDTLPCDADANGAFNIARKGLMVIQSNNKESANLIPSNEDWFRFAQER